MSIVVDRYELGPIGTNCYVVRASLGASEAVVIDPSGDVPSSGSSSRGSAPRCAAILITHGHWDHLVGVADLAEGTGAPVYMAAAEQALLENLPDLVPAGVTAPRLQGGRPARGRRAARARGHRVRDAPGAGPLARPPRVPRRRLPLLGRRPLRGLGRPHRPARRRLGHARRDAARRSRSASRRRPSSTPATARRRRSATSSPATRSSPRCAPRESFEAPRGTHDILPAEQPSGGSSPARSSGSARSTAIA